MVQAVENFPFFESWRKHRNRQLSEAWRKVLQELSQKGAQVGEFHCVGGGFPEVCVSEQPLTYNALRSTAQCHSGRQSWAIYCSGVRWHNSALHLLEIMSLSMWNILFREMKKGQTCVRPLCGQTR
jgi:hypothetical protein